MNVKYITSHSMKKTTWQVRNDGDEYNRPLLIYQNNSYFVVKGLRCKSGFVKHKITIMISNENSVLCKYEAVYTTT